jgi:predicted  nucleic acid-binding Zn-ribbon protein
MPPIRENKKKATKDLEAELVNCKKKIKSLEEKITKLKNKHHQHLAERSKGIKKSNQVRLGMASKNMRSLRSLSEDSKMRDSFKFDKSLLISDIPIKKEKTIFFLREAFFSQETKNQLLVEIKNYYG